MLSSKIYEYWTTTLILGINYENRNDVLKMINKAPKTKIMSLFTWLMNKQKYSNNISIKKGD